MTSRFALAVVVTLAALASAAAQDWPAKTVRLIVPFGPGSTPDLVGRMIADHLQQTLGQSFVVENRPGASTRIGMELVARAAPDGYTILLTNVGALAVAPHLYPTLAFNPQRDFVPLTLAVAFANILVVHPSVKATTLADFACQTCILHEIVLALERDLARLRRRFLPTRAFATSSFRIARCVRAIAATELDRGKVQPHPGLIRCRRRRVRRARPGRTGGH